MAILGGTQEYSIRANWKLLVENSIDGYHAATTHASYLDYLKGTAGALAAVPLSGVGRDLGNGHGVVEYAAPWGRPIGAVDSGVGRGRQGRRRAARRRPHARFGPERAQRIALKNRNLLIFPNLVVNDIMAITVRTFYPVAPDNMHVNAWTLAPANEGAWSRKARLENFLEFLGPGGFATPDDVEALQQCQRGYENSREAAWNDISRGMAKEQPSYDDEAQIRAFWLEWHARIERSGAGRLRARAPCSLLNRRSRAAKSKTSSIEEAALLDDWQLDDWLALYTADARYQVPATDLAPGAQPETSLFYIADDAFRLSERVKRLLKKTAFSEQPRSKTRHLVSNVRILENGAQHCRVGSAFVTYRTKGGVTDTYIGSSEHRLVRSAAGLRIAYKRCTLDLDSLRPQGRISILL